MTDNFSQNQISDRKSLPHFAVITVIISLVIFLAYVIKDIYEVGFSGVQFPSILSITHYFNQGREVEKLRQAAVKQEKADQEFSDFEYKVANKYPWRRKLPLTGNKYFVIYDILAKKFVARLYPGSADNVQQLQQEVIRRLKKEKGIDLEKYIIDFDTWPRSSLDPY